MLVVVGRVAAAAAVGGGFGGCFELDCGVRYAQVVKPMLYLALNRLHIAVVAHPHMHGKGVLSRTQRPHVQMMKLNHVGCIGYGFLNLRHVDVTRQEPAADCREAGQM